MPNLIDETGKRFGNLTVLKRVANASTGLIRYLVRCSCGTETVMQAGNFRSGRTTQCKHCGHRSAAKLRITHGMTHHPAHAVWNTMKQRCQNPGNKQYSDYGGRGVTVCKRWQSFESFWIDMGPTYRKGLTLDRRNNDGPYNKVNCRWVTQRVQNRNTRQNRMIQTPRGPMLLCDAAEISGIKAITLHARIKGGWSASDLFNPLFSRRV